MLLDLKVLNDLDEDAKREVAATLTLVDELVDDNPLLKFNNPRLIGEKKVHHKQLAFMRDMARLRAFLGGNRSAKTTGSLVDDIIQAIDAEAVPDHLRGIKRWEPPFRCRIVAADRNYTMEEVIYPIIKDWVPRSQLKGGSWDTAFDKSLYKLQFANGSYFSFMTYEQDVDKFRGSALERCLSEDTRILARSGWVGPDDLRVGDEILTYDTDACAYTWKSVVRVHIEEVTEPLVRLSSRNNFDALVTSDHRWWVHNKKTGERYFATTSDLKTSEQLIVGADHGPLDDHEAWSDEFVALVGWLITDGWIGPSNMTIGQSLSYNRPKCDQIEALLTGHDYAIHDRPYGKDECEGTMRNFAIRGTLRKALLAVVGADKELPVSFISGLSLRQREILLDAIIAGDGMWYGTGRWSVTSSNPQHQEAIQYLATLCGWRTRISKTKNDWVLIYAKSKSERYDYNKVSVDSLVISEEQYTGRVWCPSTESGTVVAKRDGSVFVTGNCHFDEEPPRDIYKECRKRLISTKGDIVLSMTPETGFTDVMMEIHERRHEDGISVHRISMDDNPWIDPQEIKDFVRGLTPDEERAYRHGHIVHFAGMVFDKYWSDDLIISGFDPKSLYGQAVVVGIDPGVVNTGICWVAFDDDNCGLVFESMKLKDMTVDLVVEEIRRVNAEWGIKEPDYYVIDPSSRNRNHAASSDNVNAESIEGEYNRHGIYVMHGQNDVPAGVSQLQRRMQAKQLLATSNNIELFDEIEKYRKDPKVDGKFAVIKVNDHILDALRYVVMSRPWIGNVEIKKKGYWARGDDGQVINFRQHQQKSPHPLGDMV